MEALTNVYHSQQDVNMYLSNRPTSIALLKVSCLHIMRFLCYTLKEIHKKFISPAIYNQVRLTFDAFIKKQVRMYILDKVQINKESSHHLII